MGTFMGVWMGYVKIKHTNIGVRGADIAYISQREATIMVYSALLLVLTK